MDVAPLRLLAMGERNRLQIFIGAHEREPEVSLAAIALRVQFGETAPDELAQKRCQKRIYESTPDHIAGDMKAGLPDPESEVVREAPENANEADKQDRRIEQPDRQRRGHFCQFARILVQPLIRVDAERARERQPVSARAIEPLIDDIA